MQGPALTAALLSLVAPTGAAGLAECSSSSGSGTNTGSTTAAGDEVDPRAPERSPPGDISDDQRFVDFTDLGGAFSVKAPEGWSSHRSGPNRHLPRQLQRDL